MTVRKGLVAGLILGPACCWAFAATASAQDASATTALAPTAELQQVTVTANFIRPGGQSALKMNVPVKDVPFALVDYASLKVSNLLDKRYYQSAFSDVRIAPGDPREFALTLNKTFN